MSNTKKIKRELYGKDITATLEFTGEGISCFLTGGDLPHVGAVGKAWKDPENEKVNIEVTQFEGHREGILANKWARSLFERYEVPVTVSCGIHYDGLTKEGIDEVLKIADEMLEEMLK